MFLPRKYVHRELNFFIIMFDSLKILLSISLSNTENEDWNEVRKPLIVVEISYTNGHSFG